MTSVYSLLNRLRALYALYRALDELVPGHPAFAFEDDAKVCASSVRVHCVTGPATHVGVVIASSYTIVRPFGFDFLYPSFWLVHGSALESSMHVLLGSNVLYSSSAMHA